MKLIKRRWKRLALGLILGLVILNLISKTSPSPQPSGTLPTSNSSLPATTIAFDSDRSGNFEVYTMTNQGSNVTKLTNDGRFDAWWPRISPDRRHILFYRNPKGTHDTAYDKSSLWVMNADGSTQTELIPAGSYGWNMQGHGEWSPDGRQIVMIGGRTPSTQIFITDSSGKNPSQVTNRPGTNIDPSWSPDGGRIVFIGCPQAICFEKDYEVYTVAAAGGESTRITQDGLRDHDPYYSPDGSRIAWLTQTEAGLPGVWNIRIMSSGGSGQRRVTNDKNINSKPQWSADGSLIYFHRLEIGHRSGFNIFSIRPDGSGLTEIGKGAPGVNEFPSI